jgi:hypothetical protein
VLDKTWAMPRVRSVKASVPLQPSSEKNYIVEIVAQELACRWAGVMIINLLLHLESFFREGL